MGEEAYTFEVVEGLTEVFDFYDVTGRKVYSGSHRSPSLPKGVYIRRTRVTSPKGDISTSSEKVLATQ